MLYEAAELEHNLMCTYLYAAFSLRDGEAEGLSKRETEAVARFRQVIMKVAVEEMGHLAAGWKHHRRARRLTALRSRQLPARPG